MFSKKRKQTENRVEYLVGLIGHKMAFLRFYEQNEQDNEGVTLFADRCRKEIKNALLELKELDNKVFDHINPTVESYLISMRELIKIESQN